MSWINSNTPIYALHNSDIMVRESTNFKVKKEILVHIFGIFWYIFKFRSSSISWHYSRILVSSLDILCLSRHFLILVSGLYSRYTTAISDSNFKFSLRLRQFFLASLTLFSHSGLRPGHSFGISWHYIQISVSGLDIVMVSLDIIFKFWSTAWT